MYSLKFNYNNFLKLCMSGFSTNHCKTQFCRGTHDKILLILQADVVVYILAFTVKQNQFVCIFYYIPIKFILLYKTFFSTKCSCFESFYVNYV